MDTQFASIVRFSINCVIKIKFMKVPKELELNLISRFFLTDPEPEITGPFGAGIRHIRFWVLMRLLYLINLKLSHKHIIFHITWLYLNVRNGYNYCYYILCKSYLTFTRKWYGRIRRTVYKLFVGFYLINYVCYLT